jgi:hypothetical protein
VLGNSLETAGAQLNSLAAAGNVPVVVVVVVVVAVHVLVEVETPNFGFTRSDFGDALLALTGLVVLTSTVALIGTASFLFAAILGSMAPS